jgi:hypothetical protein
MLGPLVLQDILNVAFILLWFQNDIFCIEFNLGCRGPWYFDSPVQWINLGKLSILIALSIKIIIDLDRRSKLFSPITYLDKA